MDQDKPSSDRLYEWAKYLRDNEVYFSIANCYPRAGELKSYLTKEEKEKVAEIAGDYYLGEEIGEFGSWYATKAKGYGVSKISENAVQGLKNAKEATETYIRQIKKVSDMMHATGSDNVTSLQAVTFNSYDYDAGIEESGLELALPNMEPIMAFGRGAERAYKKDVLGSWLAHEFYGGYRQFDPLKAKRFKMEYYTMYLAGIDYTVLNRDTAVFILTLTSHSPRIIQWLSLISKRLRISLSSVTRTSVPERTVL
jgi:hypothetical protein